MKRRFLRWLHAWTGRDWVSGLRKCPSHLPYLPANQTANGPRLGRRRSPYVTHIPEEWKQWISST